MSPMAKMPGLRGLEFRGVDRDQVLVEVQAPIGDRTELHRQPEERQHARRRDLDLLAVLVLDDGVGEPGPSRPCSPLTWPIASWIFPSSTSARILLTLSGAARNSSRRWRSVRLFASGCRFSVQSSAEVAAADDQHVVAAEVVHPPDGVEDRRALIGLDAGHRRPLRLERPAAGGDDHDLAEERLPRSVVSRKRPSGRRSSALHHLAEVEGRLERLDLLEELVDQPLAGDHRVAGNVVDRLLGIELGALAARPVENVDDRRA